MIGSIEAIKASLPISQPPLVIFTFPHSLFHTLDARKGYIMPRGGASFIATLSSESAPPFLSMCRARIVVLAAHRSQPKAATTASALAAAQTDPRQKSNFERKAASAMKPAK